MGSKAAPLNDQQKESFARVYRKAVDFFEYDFIPIATDRCNRCEDRIEKGKQPLCVQDCSQIAWLSVHSKSWLIKSMGKSTCSIFRYG